MPATRTPIVPSRPIITLKKVSKRVLMAGKPLIILHPIDLCVQKGEFVCLMGPSGSGKSTLLSLLGGLDTPSSGTLWVCATPLHQMKEKALAVFRNRSIGFVFQSFQLIPSLTALENVQAPMEIARIPRVVNKAKERLDQVGLAERMRHYPNQLSGGEQQRVALARAFAMDPPLLLADEPTGNLDEENSLVVLNLLKRMHKENNTTLVMVSHDAIAAKQASHILHMRGGKIVPA